MAFERPDDELDPILERHFSGHLDSQLGRASRAFEEHWQRSARRTRVIRFGAGIGGLAAAAMIALVLVPHGGVVPVVQPPAVPVAETPADGQGALEQVVWSRTTDLGTVLLDGRTPARKIVRERVREVRWTDSAGTRHLKASKPEQDVLLISLDTY